MRHPSLKASRPQGDDSQGGADSRRLESAFPPEPFTLKTAGRILLATPVYHEVYSPGELRFITASTYRGTPDDAGMIFNLRGSNNERPCGIAGSKRRESAPPGESVIAG